MCNNNVDRNGPVCIFDSGIGGLNLLAECARLCPSRDFIYFADNYNMPYGSLEPERVRELVFAIFARMAEFSPSAAVVACNTATALCISDLRKRYDFPIIGIQPAIKQAVKVAGECLVLATPATVSSPSFIALCKKYGEGRVRAAGCPSLAAYIENNIDLFPDFDLSGLLPPFNPASVVLGCTHYVFAAKAISEAYSCATYDGILGTSDHLCLHLGNEHKISLNNQKIEFIGGDFNKNRRIFGMLTGYKNNNRS